MADVSPEEEREPQSLLLLIALGLNTFVTLSAMGFGLYSKVLYKRPKVTDALERSRLFDLYVPVKMAEKNHYFPFRSMTVNIASNPDAPRAADGTAGQIQGKLHYLTVSFSLELRDVDFYQQMTTYAPFIIDQVIRIVGKKPFHELATVQGRYVLASEILDAANQLISQRDPGYAHQAALSHVYFEHFMVQ